MEVKKSGKAESKKVFGDFEKYVKKHGGWKVFMDSWDQFAKDNVFLDKHYEEWKELHPDMWVAVFKEELIACDSNYDNLLKKTAVKKVREPYQAVIKFISTKDIHIILNLQAAAEKRRFLFGLNFQGNQVKLKSAF
jgi:hypothetical protein